MAAEKEVAFLRFILHASKKQQYWLLDNLTPTQLDAIGEACYQLLYADRDVSSVKKDKNIIRQVGDKKVSSTRRRYLVKKKKGVALKAIEIALQ